MLKITKKDKRTKLEKEIESVIEKMGQYGPETEEYSKIADNLEILYKAKAKDEEGRNRVSMDTVALILGNIAVTMLVLNFEKADIITSKALNYVIKGRV